MKKILLIFIIALAPRLLLIHTHYWTSPDALEYLSTARNLSSGKGFTSTIKNHHFNDDKIVRPALGTKPPLFSIALSILLNINSNPFFIQFCLLTLGAVSIVLFYLFCSQIITEKFALLATILFALNPDYLINNRLILTEPLYLCLVFLALFFVVRKKPNLILTALVTSLAYLTRIETLILIPTVILYLAFNQPRSNLLKSTVLYIFLTLFFLLPYFIINFLTNGSPLANVGNFHFITLDYMNSAFNEYGKAFSTPLVFILSHPSEVITKCLQIAFELIKKIFRPSNLGILFLIPWWLNIPKKSLYISLLILLNLLLISITFGLVVDAPRYLILIDSLVILLAVKHFSLNRSLFGKLILVIVFIVYLIFDLHRLTWARNLRDTNWDSPALNQVTNLINTLPNTGIVASENPALIDVKTGHPSVLLPNNLNQELLQQYLNEYQPAVLLVTNTQSETFRTLNNSNIITKLEIPPYYFFSFIK